MQARERMRRFAWATAFMLAGTVGVIGTVVLINLFSDSLEDSRAEATSQIALERKKPPPEQQVQKPKPKPKPQRSRRAPPNPLTGLDTSLSGVDMGLPGFSADDLGGLEGDLHDLGFHAITLHVAGFTQQQLTYAALSDPTRRAILARHGFELP